jgi:predicted HTH transcriptional regulator
MHHEFKMMKKFEMDMIVKYICAFLNSEGGTLYIGITDDGIIKGFNLSRKIRDEFCL